MKHVLQVYLEEESARRAEIRLGLTRGTVLTHMWRMKKILGLTHIGLIKWGMNAENRP